VAILNELGIESEPAMVSTVLGDGLDERLPNIESFNHILVKVSIEGQIYWLDGTRQGDRSLDRLETPPFRWALPVTDKGSGLVKIEQKPLNEPNAVTTIRLDATAGIFAPALAHLETRFSGDAAKALNAAAATASAGDLDKYFRSYWASEYRWIEPAKVGYTYDDAKGEAVITLDGAAAMDWSNEAQDGSREYQTDEGRLGDKFETKREPGPFADAPFVVAYPLYSRSVETILLPQGGKGFAITGENIDRTAGNIAYKRIAKLENGVVSIEATKRSLAPEIAMQDAAKAKLELRELWDSALMIRAPKNYRSGDAETELLLARAPSTSLEYMSRADSWFAKKNVPKAIADLDAAVRLKPDDPDPLNSRCWIRALSGTELEAALEDCNAALDLEPNSSRVLDSRGLVYYRLGKHDRAIADLNQALKVTPDLANSLFVRGLARSASGDAKGGREDVNAARKISRQIAAYYAEYGIKAGR
jgi:tetratricopeptide (TPR) repeat protein